MNEFIELLASKIDWESMEKENPDLYEELKHLKDTTDGEPKHD